MTTCAIAPKQALKRALGLHGSWMGRAPLAAAVAKLQGSTPSSEGRLDDELADLVVAGDVLFNERSREYRLAGTPLARKALQRLLAEPVVDGAPHQQCLLMMPSADKTVMRGGLAVRRLQPDGEELLCMAELEMPHHQGDPAAAQAVVHAFGRFAQPTAASAARP